MKMYKCAICNREFKSQAGLSNHLTRSHKISHKVYYDKYIKIDKPRCIYCNKEITSFNLDHFIPWSKFPVDRFWNLFPTCPSCNSKKSNKIIEIEKTIHNRLIDYLKIWLLYFKENKDEMLFLGGKEAAYLDFSLMDKSVNLLVELLKEINNDLI